MCGIAGIVTKNTKDAEPLVQNMVQRLRHRGPDSAGYATLPGCVLGHARLAVIDQSTGSQPMRNAAAAVTFNGEIFGYQDIRRALGTHYPFQTSSDTEVILALYAQHGERFLEHLPGQFAFGLWDEREQKLMLARDRFGEKPLYYAHGRNGEFLFASELKGLLASGLIDPVLNPDSLAHYLKHLYVHPTATIYQNIFTLPPAHLLVLAGGTMSITRYWNLPPLDTHLTAAEAAQRLRELLDRSVTEQLISDVPLGAFLSGGLDSSTIVALASRHTKKLKTFSFRFDAERDETPYAREIAERYGTDHTELSPATHDLGALLSRMQEVYDEPFADSSNIPTYLLSEAARQHVTVALTGDGGDELFGGYANWYRPLAAMQALEQRPSLMTVARLYVRAKLDRARHMQYLGARFKHAYASLLAAHENQDVAFSDSMLDGLLRAPHRAPALSATGDNLDAVMREDIQNYMPGDILVKTDRASMAHGLELRAPFLGKEFAEFALSLPWQLKITGDGEKQIFRQAFSELWTERVRTRKKQGFGAPVARWLADPSIATLKQILDDPQARVFSLVSFAQTRRYAKERSSRAWALLVLALWAESHDFRLG